MGIWRKRKKCEAQKRHIEKMSKYDDFLRLFKMLIEKIDKMNKPYIFFLYYFNFTFYFVIYLLLCFINAYLYVPEGRFLKIRFKHISFCFYFVVAIK